MDVEGVSIQFKKHERQRLQLFQRKCADGATALQDEQWSEIQQTRDSLDRGCHQQDEQRQPRDTPVHGLEQVIVEKGVDNVEYNRHEGGGEPQPKQPLVPQDVGCCCRGVARKNEPAENDHLAECCRHGFEQLKKTGHSRRETRRRFCDSFHHFIPPREGHFRASRYITDTSETRLGPCQLFFFLFFFHF